MTDITLADLGNIGEFFGAIGVIATLIYLAMQIRQNTASIRAATYHAIVESYADFNSLIAQDSDVARIFQTGLTRAAELSETDALRFDHLLLSAVRRWENAFYQSGISMLDPSQARGLLLGTKILLGTPGGRVFWQRFRHYYSDEFRGWVEANVDLESEKET